MPESFDSSTLHTLDMSQQPSGDSENSQSLPQETTSTSALCEHASSSSSVEVIQPPLSLNAGYKLVFDNIDKTVKPRFMRLDSQTVSLHYVQMYAVKDRVDYSTEPCQKAAEVNLYDVLPSCDDYDSLKRNFSVLISQMIVTYLPFFGRDFKDVVQRHIPHKHSAEMCKKSEVVSYQLSDALD